MDEDLLRRKHILEIILIGSIAMLAVLDAFVLFHSLQEGAAYRDVSFAAFSVLPALFILFYILSRSGFPKLASYLSIAAYLAADSYAAYRYGAGLQVVLIAYALIIVMATILRGPKFGFLVTGLIAAYIIPLWYGEIHHMIIVQPQGRTGDDAIVFSILFFLIMIVAWLYDREIERSLRRAKSSEAALREERDLLEVKVAERTDELRRTQLEKIRQLGRLAELGQLSSGLFHDLLNLLNALSLRMEDEHDPSLANAFNTAKQIEIFVQAVRKQMGGADVRSSYSLVQGVDHAIQLVNYQANKAGVRLIFRRPDAAMAIIYFGAAYQFQEIVINLLLNAIESYDGLPRSTARARTVEVSIENIGGTATLRIRDNGCGMAPSVRARIFEPFFTTKDAEKGIGIGLPTIKKIIEHDLSGAIAVESKPDAGSTFTVTFPINHEKIPGADRPSPHSHRTPTVP